MKNIGKYRKIIAFGCLLLVAVWGILTRPQYGQAKLPSETLTIINSKGDRRVFDVELATTPKQQEAGLMFRRSLAPDAGMLFIFAKPQVVDFWMKNTVLPLDMIFIRKNGVVDSIAENAPPYSLANIFSAGVVIATLEIPAGTSARLDLQPDDKVISTQFPD